MRLTSAKLAGVFAISAALFQLGTALIFMPMSSRDTIRRHLGERLLKEISELDFPRVLAGGDGPMALKRRSTSEPHEAASGSVAQRAVSVARDTREQVVAPTPDQEAALDGASTKSNGKEQEAAASARKDVPAFDILGDPDWPPRPSRARARPASCIYLALAPHQISRIRGCPGMPAASLARPDTAWTSEGPIQGQEKFYLRQGSGWPYNVMTDMVERMVDKWLENGAARIQRRRASAGSTATTPDAAREPARASTEIGLARGASASQ